MMDSRHNTSSGAFKKVMFLDAVLTSVAWALIVFLAGRLTVIAAAAVTLWGLFVFFSMLAWVRINQARHAREGESIPQVPAWSPTLEWAELDEDQYAETEKTPVEACRPPAGGGV